MASNQNASSATAKPDYVDDHPTITTHDEYVVISDHCDGNANMHNHWIIKYCDGTKDCDGNKKVLMGHTGYPRYADFAYGFTIQGWKVTGVYWTNELFRYRLRNGTFKADGGWHRLDAKGNLEETDLPWGTSAGLHDTIMEIQNRYGLKNHL